jgi:hypothetical protein
MNHPFRGATSVLTALLVISLVACEGVETPTAVAPGASGALFSSAEGGPDLSRLARFQAVPEQASAPARAWIGAEGGRLEHRGFAIEVPPGAVSSPTLFSIRLPANDSGSDRVVAVFHPHGATFAVPVSIEFPYAGTSIFGTPDATVVWWDPGARDWVDIGGVVTEDGARLRAHTPHFSTYGTSDGRGGSVTVSGG